MTLGVSLYETRRTLTRPAANARAHWHERRACMIALQAESGARGLGEASPLPGFSSDSLDDCYRALAGFEPSGVPSRLEPGQSLLAELERVSRRLPNAVPAARAALEGALLDLWSRAAGLPAWALLGDARAREPEPRSISALLGDPEEAVEQARAASARGIRSFKFKVGRSGAFERELRAVRDLRAELGAGAQLRLDANRSLSLEQAQACLPRLAEYDLEFFEEPCPLPVLSGRSARALPVPLAFDESLIELDPQLDPAIELDRLGARALILKPTLLGGIVACSAWAQIAARIGAEVVLSHAFEGPVGFSLGVALSLSMGTVRMAHGLDPTGAGLEQHPLLGVSGAQIRPWSELGFGHWEPGT